MKRTKIVDGHKVGDGYTWASLRYIAENYPVFINEDIDMSSHMRMHFYNTIDFHSKWPTKLYLQIIKNKSLKATKENALLNLEIPVLPVGYMTESEEDYEKLIKYGTPENIQKENEALSPEESDRRIKEHADEALNYFLYKIAERYYKAVKNKDKKTMNMLANLEVVKEFNFDFDSFIKLCNDYNDHSVDLNFTMAYKKSLETELKYDKLLKVIEEYSTYEVKQEIQQNKTNHSNKPRTVGRPSTKPSEPGDE